MLHKNQTSVRFYGHTFVAISKNVVKVIPDAHFMHDTFFYRGLTLSDIEFYHNTSANEDCFWRALQPWEVSAYHCPFYLDELIELAAVC